MLGLLAQSAITTAAPMVDDGLVLYYSFDDVAAGEMVAGGTVQDESGQGNHGILQGALGLTSDALWGNAYDFRANSSRDYILAPNPTRGEDAFSVAMWIKADDWSRNNKVASTLQWGGSATGWMWGTHYAEMDQSGTNLRDDGGYPLHKSLYADKSGVWTHVVMAYDTMFFREWIDGDLFWEFEHSPQGETVVGRTDLSIGNWAQLPGFGYIGLIDEFRVYDRMLNQSDVDALMVDAPMHEVPLPSALVLLASGLLGLGVVRHIRRLREIQSRPSGLAVTRRLSLVNDSPFFMSASTPAGRDGPRCRPRMLLGAPVDAPLNNLSRFKEGRVWSISRWMVTYVLILRIN